MKTLRKKLTMLREADEQDIRRKQGISHFTFYTETGATYNVDERLEIST